MNPYRQLVRIKVLAGACLSDIERGEIPCRQEACWSDMVGIGGCPFVEDTGSIPVRVGNSFPSP